MCILGTLTLVSVSALFRPTPSCDTLPANDALHTWNHFFPAATHNVPVHCADALNISVAVSPQGGIDLKCHDKSSCNAAVSAYVIPADAQGQPLMAELAATSAMFGLPHVACNSTADCVHPAAVCTFNTTVENIGYCAPGPVAAPEKQTCYSGLHASCDELISASVGLAAGAALWFINSLVHRPFKIKKSEQGVTAMNVLDDFTSAQSTRKHV